MIKFKAGDSIKVTSGKDRGREGVIEKVLPKLQSVLVPNINIYKKHVKGVQGQKGGIYDIPRPLNYAKIALLCPKCKKATRIGAKNIDNQKIRYCKKCKKEI